MLQEWLGQEHQKENNAHLVEEKEMEKQQISALFTTNAYARISLYVCAMTANLLSGD